ncbi:MAG: 16S rRNA processing protein RimM [Deltaproteobacteria bacterium]|nr:16S rRNA processing protein RimM [Deltaproteobacteria bacterium]
MSKGGKVALGRVAGAHGVSGELKIVPYIAGDDAVGHMEFFRSACKTLHIGGVSYAVRDMKHHGGVLLVTLEGVIGREGASALRGKEVLVERDALPEPSEGEYYRFDLIGIEVRTEDGQYLGEVTDVFSTGSNDVYEVTGPMGEVLLPAIKECVIAVDVPGRSLTVRPMDGLLPEARGRGEGALKPANARGKRGKK